MGGWSGRVSGIAVRPIHRDILHPVRRISHTADQTVSAQEFRAISPRFVLLDVWSEYVGSFSLGLHVEPPEDWVLDNRPSQQPLDGCYDRWLSVLGAYRGSVWESANPPIDANLQIPHPTPLGLCNPPNGIRDAAVYYDRAGNNLFGIDIGE